MSFVPYQVDYSVKNTAKTLGFSKKRVSFKFGFASPQAMEQGLTGAQCRGSEHEVVFLWSLKSGKRQLYLDGKDVHYSESGMNGWTVDREWQHSFPLREMGTNRTFKVHFISQPINKDLPESKAFDLRVNGVSYFRFNEIWKLGTGSMTSRVGPGGQTHSIGRDSPTTVEERRMIAMAKAESLREFEKQQSQRSQPQAEKPQMQRQEEALISFDDPPQMVQTGHMGDAPGGQQNYQQHASSLTLDPSIDDRRATSGGSYGVPYGAPYGQTPPSSNPYGQTPPSSNPYGAPPPVPEYSPYGAPPAASGNSTVMTSYTGGSGASQSHYSQPPPPVQTYGYGNANAAPQPSPGFNPLTSPSGQSYASYGSAPSFARPPPTPAPAPMNPYGAPPPPPAAGYTGYSPQPPGPGGGYPPQQYQQQQQQYPPSQYQQQTSYGYPNQPAY